jgi:hypothetical protein
MASEPIYSTVLKNYVSAVFGWHSFDGFQEKEDPFFISRENIVP